jgi:hypothetical protein
MGSSDIYGFKVFIEALVVRGASLLPICLGSSNVDRFFQHLHKFFNPSESTNNELKAKPPNYLWVFPMFVFSFVQAKVAKRFLPLSCWMPPLTI